MYPLACVMDFQSTPPRGGSQGLIQGSVYGKTFQSTPLSQRGHSTNALNIFQSPLPVWRETAHSAPSDDQQFLFTPPAWVETLLSYSIIRCSVVSILSTFVGGDTIPHASVEQELFQSTPPPVREETSANCLWSSTCKISIHSLAWRET